MAQVTTLGRVMVPVADQDAAIDFYKSKLGFSVLVDVAFGEGDRWVEVEPPGGGAAIAFVPPRGDYQPGRNTGIALETTDARADHDELKSAGVDVDDILGGDGPVPVMFFMRDNEKNELLVVQAPER